MPSKQPLKTVPTEHRGEFFLFECYLHTKDPTIDFLALANDLKIPETDARSLYAGFEKLCLKYDPRTFGSALRRAPSSKKTGRKIEPATPKKRMKLFDDMNEPNMMTPPKTPTEGVTSSSRRGTKRNLNFLNDFSPTPFEPSEQIVISDDDELPPVKKAKNTNHQPPSCETAPSSPETDVSNRKILA